MKKIVKWLCIGGSLFLTFKTLVKAEKFELIPSEESVTYMIEKGTHKFQLYFYLVRDMKTQELVYCLEPGIALSNSEYEALKEIEYSKLNLTAEELDYITRVAYFGYNTTTHQSINYYYAAQLLIWQKIIPSDWRIYYTDGLGGSPINPYQNEQQIIETLMANDELLPDFANQTFSWNTTSPLILKDNTNTLANYQMINDDKVKITKKENILEINMDEPSDTTIELVKNYEGKPLQFFYREDGQNVLKRGALSPQKFNLYLKPFETKVELLKTDEEKKPLKDIPFRLLKKDTMEELGKYTTNDQGKIILKNLSLGKYCWEEISTPDDFLPPSKLTCFELTSSQYQLTIPIINERKKTQLIIQKIDATTKERLKKVRFQVWFQGNCIFDGTTDESGEVKIDNLINGEYQIIEIETLEGYYLEKEARVIKIDGKAPQIYLTIENRKIKKVPNTSENIPLNLFFNITYEERKKKI